MGVGAMKEYTILPSASELKPHHQTEFSVISQTVYYRYFKRDN